MDQVSYGAEEVGVVCVDVHLQAYACMYIYVGKRGRRAHTLDVSCTPPGMH